MIPPVAHFIWFGREFPWLNCVAVRSAALRGGFDQVVLHHDRDLSGSKWWPELNATPGFQSRLLEPFEIIEASNRVGPSLIRLYSELDNPSIRSDVIRALILAEEGGVYLDMDTITVSSLTPLRERSNAFCGLERRVFPTAKARYSRNPVSLTRGALLHALREVFRYIPGGWRHFRVIEPYYPTAAASGVLACMPGHALVLELLDKMATVPRDLWNRLCVLGPHLLHESVQDYLSRGATDLELLAPSVFYPLGPRISDHWFRFTDHVGLDEAVLPDVRVVHWYSSSQNRDLISSITPSYVKAFAQTQLLSALLTQFVE